MRASTGQLIAFGCTFTTKAYSNQITFGDQKSRFCVFYKLKNRSLTVRASPSSSSSIIICLAVSFTSFSISKQFFFSILSPFFPSFPPFLPLSPPLYMIDLISRTPSAQNVHHLLSPSDDRLANCTFQTLIPNPFGSTFQVDGCQSLAPLYECFSIDAFEFVCYLKSRLIFHLLISLKLFTLERRRYSHLPLQLLSRWSRTFLSPDQVFFLSPGIKVVLFAFSIVRLSSFDLVHLIRRKVNLFHRFCRKFVHSSNRSKRQFRGVSSMSS